MPCSDSSSGLNIRLDLNERLIKFDFAKITCSQEISANTGYSKYCGGKTLDEILGHSYHFLISELGLELDEEKQFVLHLEWEALRAGIGQYLGIEREDIDKNRCQITSIQYDDTGVEIAEVILPPKELPKILPCRLAQE